MKKNERYNEGVASGIKVAQKIIEKETKTLDYLKKQIDKIFDKQSGMHDAVEAIISEQNNEAICKYYGLYNQKSPRDLSSYEKSMLMNILATLGVEGASKNQEQEKYLNNLRRFVGVSDYEINTSYAYENIDNIKNIDSQMIMAKAIREYLFLANNESDIFAEYTELFGMFRLNDRDYMSIDGMIAITYILFGCMGIVETYGNCYNEDADVDKTLPYLNVKKVDKKQISRECAEIYFSNRSKRKNNKYVESSSYIIYEEDNCLVAYHKESSEKKIIITDGSEIDKMFAMKNITAYQDMVFYVMGNEVYFFNLLDEVNGLVMSIEKHYNKKGELMPIRNIGAAEGNLIYGNDKLYVINLKTKETRTIDYNNVYGELGSYSNYIIIENYMYFLIQSFSEDTKNKVVYKIMRYGFKSKKTTELSKFHMKAKIFKDNVENIAIESFDKNMIILLRKYSMERDNNSQCGEFFCVVMNTEDENATPQTIEIKGKHKTTGKTYINQLSVYNNHLVFMDHRYEICSLEIMSGNQVAIKKKCGKDNSKDIFEVATGIKTFGIKDYVQFTDKYRNKNPGELMLMGNWLYCNKGTGGEICSILIENESV